MFTVKCHVCNKDIGFLGFANHVKMEKKLHGKDIYKKLKAKRKGKEYKADPKDIPPRKNHSLLEYGDEQ